MSAAHAAVIAIIGAGTMGRGIAQSVICSGQQAILIDRQPAVLDDAQLSISASLTRAVERGTLDIASRSAMLARLTIATELRSAVPADVVIEAIPEDLALKRRVLAEVSAYIHTEAIIATNTSAIRLAALAGALPDPARFLGLHYFFPAASNKLLEIVRGDDTSAATFERAWAFAELTGKVALVCRDSNGFVVNRFFAPWLNEAVRLADDGASRAAIEASGRASFGAPFGPFELMGMTKTEIALHAMEQLSALSAFYTPAAGLVRQVALRQEWQVDEPEAGPEAALTERLRAAVWLAAGELLDSEICEAGAIELGSAVGLRWTLGPIGLFAADRSAAYSAVERIAARYNVPVPRSLGRLGVDPAASL